MGARCNLKKFGMCLKWFSAPTEPSRDEQEVEEPVVEEQAPRRSVRARRAPEKFTLLTTEQRDVLLLDNDEPKTYTEAIMGPGNGLEP